MSADPSQAAIKQILSRYTDAIEATIADNLSDVLPDLGNIIRYHLGWIDENCQPATKGRGKMLRPTIHLLVYEAITGQVNTALPTAAFLEMLHNFSLLHDDIEDNDRERRGRPTAWVIWGQPRAINVGDALFSLAFQALHRLDMTMLPPETVLAVFRMMSDVCVTLIQGQELDMNFERRLDVTPDMYLDMIYRKTGALIEAAVLGAVKLATSDEMLTQHYQEFASNIGLAFQIQDDILGIWGDADKTGKSADNDLRNKKKTLPIIYMLTQARGGHAEKLKLCYSSTEPLSELDIAFVRDCLASTKAYEYTKDVAAQYYEQAFTALNKIDIANEAQTGLKTLAHFLSTRTH